MASTAQSVLIPTPTRSATAVAIDLIAALGADAAESFAEDLAMHFDLALREDVESHVPRWKHRRNNEAFEFWEHVMGEVEDRNETAQAAAAATEAAKGEN